MLSNLVFKPMLVHKQDELYFTFEPFNNTVKTHIVLHQSGTIHRLVWNWKTTEWSILYTWPFDSCDHYAQCGANNNCRINKTPICECLKGFIPKAEDEWDTHGLSQSRKCIEKSPSDCPSGEGFLKLPAIKLPDFNWYNNSMNINECEAECFKNCSCRAYANSDVNGGSGCLMWFGDLIDIRECPPGFSWGQDIFLRVPASELVQHYSNKKKKIKIITVVSTITGIFILILVLCTVWKKTKNRGLESREEEEEVPLIDLSTIAAATNNFSQANMIGKGGFGPVYKGTLSTRQEIAVKRLSNNSGQDDERSKFLSWRKRFDIIIGIARGLLYLHQDSKLQIIHRDLKASNILLDNDLNPKISDFGLARIFRGDDKEANTKRIAGTYGYMSPEYATDGKFSLKSDVFSFGVLLLEIVSGKKNRGFCHPAHHLNLLGHAWVLWNNGRALEVKDVCLDDSFIESQVLRCIQVGLLCVQMFPEDRPEMSSVVFMLANEGLLLPQPKQPGFFTERGFITGSTSSGKEKSHTENAMSITTLDGRTSSSRAYVSPDVTERGSGCLMWFRELIDIRNALLDSFGDMFLRVQASEHGPESRKEEAEVQLIDLGTIAAATNNFLQENMIGKGRFGPVYKARNVICSFHVGEQVTAVAQPNSQVSSQKEVSFQVQHHQVTDGFKNLTVTVEKEDGPAEVEWLVKELGLNFESSLDNPFSFPEKEPSWQTYKFDKMDKEGIEKRTEFISWKDVRRGSKVGDKDNLSSLRSDFLEEGTLDRGKHAYVRTHRKKPFQCGGKGKIDLEKKRATSRREIREDSWSSSSDFELEEGQIMGRVMTRGECSNQKSLGNGPKRASAHGNFIKKNCGKGKWRDHESTSSPSDDGACLTSESPEMHQVLEKNMGLYKGSAKKMVDRDGGQIRGKDLAAVPSAVDLEGEGRKTSGNPKKQRKVRWSLEEEITKVIERGVALGYVFNPKDKEGSQNSERINREMRSGSFEEEITKVIEVGTALGFDFNSKEDIIGEEISQREKEDEERMAEANDR
ncbi:hypothetical protein LWI29_038397 [Acer saccharum]|uniref:non-specific serine/threonine protein kinase n=1 Tax=Acer saccharum TaxID=4024 RepID=A0AA39W692_ACESA|nr:hypothetical protein LWI29_038397 [Acer saccharum]